MASPSVWTTRELALAFACVLLFWAAAASAWPLSGSVVPWDSKNHFYPMLRYVGASLALGEWPLWNPYHFSGYPSVADPQSLLFTPLMLLLAWLVPDPSMAVFDLAVSAHLLIGAFGVIGLFYRRGWHPAGAALAGVVFILGGSAAARLQHTGMIFSYALLPMALFLLEGALERRSYVAGIFFAVVAALMALGRDHVAFLGCLIVIAAFLYQVLRSDAPLGYLRERAGVVVTMGVVGVGILAVPVLLTLQFLASSNRPEFSYSAAILGSLPPQSLATLLFPNVFGSLNTPIEYWGPGPGTLREGSWTDLSTNYVFAGTIPALLLLWHGLGAGRLARREVLFFSAIGGAALVYALGRYTPAFAVIFDYLPGANLYRRPADATFIVNFSIAIEAGYLLHRYCADGLPQFGGRLHKLIAAVLIGAFTACALHWGVDFAQRAGRLPFAFGEFASGTAILAAAAFILWRARTPQARAIVAAAVVAATGAELVWRHGATAINGEPGEHYAVFQQLPPEQLRGLQVLKRELDMRHAKGQRPRVEILGLGGPWQNASMVYGIEDTIGYNALRIADYERAVGSGENAVDFALRKFPGTFSSYRCRLASLLGLEYLVLDRPIEQLPRHFPRLSNASVIYGAGSMWIYKFPLTMPRAYLATQLIAVDSEAALDDEVLPDFDVHRSALIENADVDELTGDYGLKDQLTLPEPAAGSVMIRDYHRNAIAIDIETDRSAVLVLHDIYYPGWEVSIDGEPHKVVRMNLLFRGVEVPPGRHRVLFEFRPLSVHNLVAAASELVLGEQDDGDQDRVDKPHTPLNGTPLNGTPIAAAPRSLLRAGAIGHD